LQSGTFTNGTWSSYVEDEYAVSGQTNITTIGDTFQITGVQLEVGDTATPFEHRSYGDELARCQRYYEKFTLIDAYRPNAIAWGTGNTNAAIPFTVTKRASPTLIVHASGDVFTGSWVSADGVAIAGTGPTINGVSLDIQKASAYTVKYGYFIRNQIFSVDAEL